MDIDIGFVSIFQVTVNFMVAVACFLVTLTIFKNWRSNKMVYMFGWFWFFTFLQWFSNAFGGILYRVGAISLFEVVPFFYTAILFGFSASPPLIYYLVYKSSANKILAKVFFLIYVFVFMAGAFFLFKEGLTLRITEWGIKAPMSHYSFLIVQIIYAGLIVFLLFDFFKRIIRWILSHSWSEWYFFLSTAGLMIYVLGLYFDAQGTIVVWKILFFKLLTLFGVSLVYFAYAFGAKKKNVLVYEI